jgi:hypothetical protein
LGRRLTSAAPYEFPRTQLCFQIALPNKHPTPLALNSLLCLPRTHQQAPPLTFVGCRCLLHACVSLGVILHLPQLLLEPVEVSQHSVPHLQGGKASCRQVDWCSSEGSGSQRLPQTRHATDQACSGTQRRATHSSHALPLLRAKPSQSALLSPPGRAASRQGSCGRWTAAAPAQGCPAALPLGGGWPPCCCRARQDRQTKAGVNQLPTTNWATPVLLLLAAGF